MEQLTGDQIVIIVGYIGTAVITIAIYWFILK